MNTLTSRVTSRDTILVKEQRREHQLSVAVEQVITDVVVVKLAAESGA
jgi:hypothetical protein